MSSEKKIVYDIQRDEECIVITNSGCNQLERLIKKIYGRSFNKQLRMTIVAKKHVR